MNFYAEVPHAFTDHDVVTAGLFAGQVSALLHGADTAAHLTTALQSRDVIGQAKGILIQRFAITGDEAFQMLASSSQDTNIKLVDVARWVVREAESRSTPNRPNTPDTPSAED